MNRIGKTLTNHPKKILLLIFTITGLLFYYAFFSDQRLRIDFSLEQMFPENDPEKEFFDDYRAQFPREDDKVLLIYTPPAHPLNVESLRDVDEVVDEISNIQSKSNCVSIKDFPCKNIQYKDSTKLSDAGSAYFIDYNRNDSLFFRINHHFDSPDKHIVKIDSLPNYRIDKILKHEKYTDYVILISAEEVDDFICFEEIVEHNSKNNKIANIDIYNTPYYMVEGCYAEDQKILSLSTLPDAGGVNLFFPFNEEDSLKSNDKVYYKDINQNSKFDCEPFGCGEDNICPPYFYESLDINFPDSYSHIQDQDDTLEWTRDEYYGYTIYGDEKSRYNLHEELALNIDTNFVDQDWGERGYWDCEDFLTIRRTGEGYIANHPFYNNIVLSNRSQVGGVGIDLDDRIQGQDTRAEFFSKLGKIIKKHDDAYGWQWSEAGIPVLRTRYVELVHKERNTFIPLAFLVVTLILLFVFRQIKSIVLPIMTMSIALIWVSALMAFLSISINIVSYLTYNLLLIIGCSNAIHIQMKYHEGLFAGKSQTQSLREVISRIGGALFLTSFTTSIGFLSLFMTNIKLTREFGLILGIGVFVMFFMMIIVLPLMLLITKKPKKKMSERLMKGGSYGIVIWLNRFVNKYPKQIVICSIGLFIISFIGLMRIDYNVSILDDLKPTNKLYQDFEKVQGNMGGTFPLEIMVQFKESIIQKNGKWDEGEEFEDTLGNRVWDEGEEFIDAKNDKWDEGEDFIDQNGNGKWDQEEPFVDVLNGKWDEGEELFDTPNGRYDKGEKFVDEVDFASLTYKINKLDSMKSKIANLSNVTSANAVTDVIGLDWRMQDESGEILYGEAFDLFENYPKDQLSLHMSGYVGGDFKTLRISGRMVNVKADEAAAIKDSIDKIGRDIFKDEATVVSTGSTFLALKTASHLVTNLTNSFVLAFIIIFISMIFLFKSFKLSFISILPNIIPLMFAAAVMGFQDIKLRPTTAMTFAIALGIAVDDTIHFLARFRQEYAKCGDIRISIKRTLETTGKAIISTTMVLSLGFAVLYFSELMPNHEFGILSTIILVTALVGSIVLLPALLVLFKPKLKVKDGS